MELTILKPYTLAPSLNINFLLDNFVNSLDVKENSKLLYRRTLKLFFLWLEKKGYSLNKIARPEIIEYKLELLNSSKSALTIGSYINSVRQFYEWAETNKLYFNIAKGIKPPKRKKQFSKQPLTILQTQALLNYSITTPRDTAILNLLLRTGLRTIEVTRANIEDIQTKGNKKVLLIHGKGRDAKDNFVILTEKTYSAIGQYLATRIGLEAREPLFISESNNNLNQRLTPRTISFIAKERLKAIGLKEKQYSAHSLRHTTAINILRAGGTLENVQYTLRHTNPTTTQIYTASIEEERRLEASGEFLLETLF